MEDRMKSVSTIKIKIIRPQKQIQDVLQAEFCLVQSKIRWPGGKVSGQDVREELLLQAGPAVPTAISRFAYYGIKSSFHVCDKDLRNLIQKQVSKQVKKKNIVDSLGLSEMYATALGKQVPGYSTSSNEANNKKRDTTVTVNPDGAIMLRLKHRCVVAPPVSISVVKISDEQIRQILEPAKCPNFSNPFYTALGAISMNRLKDDVPKYASDDDDIEQASSPSQIDFPIQANAENKKLRNHSAKKKIVTTATSPLVTSARPLTSDVSKPGTEIQEKSVMTICKDNSKFFNCPELSEPLSVFPSTLESLNPESRLSNKVQLDVKRQKLDDTNDRNVKSPVTISSSGLDSNKKKIKMQMNSSRIDFPIQENTDYQNLRNNSAKRKTVTTATSPLVTSAKPLTSDVNKPATNIQEKSVMTICKDNSKFFNCPELSEPLSVFPSTLESLNPESRLSNKVQLDVKRQKLADTNDRNVKSPLTISSSGLDSNKKKIKMQMSSSRIDFPIQENTDYQNLRNNSAKRKTVTTATSPLVTSARPLTSDVSKPGTDIQEKSVMTICKDNSKFFNCPELSEPLSVFPSTLESLNPENRLSNKVQLDVKRQKLADTSDRNVKSPVTISSSGLDSDKKKIKMHRNSSRLDFPIQENTDYQKLHSNSQRKKIVTSPLVTSATALSSDVNKPDTDILEESVMTVCKDNAKFFKYPELSEPLSVFPSTLQHLTPKSRLSNKFKWDVKRQQLADACDKNVKRPTTISSSVIDSDKKKMNNSQLDHPIQENADYQNKPDSLIKEKSQMTNLKDKVKIFNCPALSDTLSSTLQRFKPANHLSNSVKLDVKRQKLDNTNDRNDKSRVTISSKARNSYKKNIEIQMNPKPVMVNSVEKLDRAYRIPKRVNDIQAEVNQKRDIGISWNDRIERNKVPVDPSVSGVKKINDNDVRKNLAEMVTFKDNSNVFEAFGPELELSEIAYRAKSTSNTSPVEKINYEDDDLDVLQLCVEQDEFDLF